MNDINKVYGLNLFLIINSFLVIFGIIGYSYFSLKSNLEDYTHSFQHEVELHNSITAIESKIKPSKEFKLILTKKIISSKDYFFLKNEIEDTIKVINANNKNNQISELSLLSYEYKKTATIIENIIKKQQLIKNYPIKKIINKNKLFNDNYFKVNNINYKKLEEKHLSYVIKTKNNLDYLACTAIILIFLFILNIINCRKRKDLDHENSKQIFKYKNILNTTPNAVFVLNENGEIVESNKQFLSLVGYSRNNVKNTKYSKYFPCKDLEKTLNLEYSEEEIKFLYLFRDGYIINQKGERIEVEYSISLSENTMEDEKETLYLIVLKDLKEINKLIKENTKLQNLANKDPLTGIYNRRYILDKTKELFYKLYFNKPFAVLALDIDFFKKINDNYGHEAGDYVLKEFVSMLDEEIRTDDIFGRVGGEEFLIIISGLDLQKIKRISTRIKDKIENHTFLYKNNKINITLSIGACYLDSLIDTSFDDCINFADKALYEAKHSGRNTVCFYDFEKNGII
jgi:diguanylate cyclase (GGDEF)-like protein/PAS domain S-box-containing protein